jgi:hypothetical protein
MPQSAGEGHHKVEGVEERSTSDREVKDPADQDNPDEGPTMGGPGAQPSGNSMDHWETANPSPDATKPETMPNTESEPLPGETANRESV